MQKILANLLIINYLTIFSLNAQTLEIVPTIGMTISESCKIATGEYHFAGNLDFSKPVLNIIGENIEVDFQNATFFGDDGKPFPDQFTGIGLEIKGTNISVKNLNIRGYKIGLYGTQVVDLQVVSSDFSYNYRPKLDTISAAAYSLDSLGFQAYNFADLSQFGAGIFLNDCQNPLIKSCSSTDNQVALTMFWCAGGLIYNNDFRFNSGIGVGLFRSASNRVSHNRINWTISGYSPNKKENKPNSYAILCGYGCVYNTFAYNSATHSSTGFSLFSEEIMKNQSNGNLISSNDFSYSTAAGIEIFKGSNNFSSNYLDACAVGLRSNFADNSEFCGNVSRDSPIGFWINGASQNLILGNEFFTDSVGIQFGTITNISPKKKWDKTNEPYFLLKNKFSDTRNPLKINELSSILIDSTNQFLNYNTLFSFEKNGDSTLLFWKKTDNLRQDVKAVPLKDGADAKSFIANRRGKHWIWMTNWGPYDFRGPICYLKKVEGARYEFWMHAASTGNWQVKKMKGFKRLTMTGGFPTKLIAERNFEIPEIELQFEAVFEKEQMDIFGKKIEANKPYLFNYQAVTIK